MFVARRDLALILAGSIGPCLLLLTGAARAPASSTIEAREFVVRGPEGQVCARLGVSPLTEGKLEFFDRSGNRLRLQVGLNPPFGNPSVRFIEQTSDEPTTGSEILIEDDCGDPGEASIQLLSKPDHDGKRGTIKIRMSRGGEPEIVAISKSGHTTNLIPAK
jgi:hypothetical protein